MDIFRPSRGGSGKRFIYFVRLCFGVETRRRISGRIFRASSVRIRVFPDGANFVFGLLLHARLIVWLHRKKDEASSAQIVAYIALLVRLHRDFYLNGLPDNAVMVWIYARRRGGVLLRVVAVLYYANGVCRRKHSHFVFALATGVPFGKAHALKNCLNKKERLSRYNRSFLFCFKGNTNAKNLLRPRAFVWYKIGANYNRK